MRPVRQTITDPVLLTPGQAQRLVSGLGQLRELVARLEAAQHAAEAAGHPSFSRKVLRRWEVVGDDLDDLVLVLHDASLSNLGPVR